jgi:hypothetical protein
MTHPEDIARYRASYASRVPIAGHVAESKAGVMYTITTFGEQDYIGRTVAVVSDFALADSWLRQSAADLYETIYMFAVVEELYVDELYGGYGREQFWYAWEPQVEGFRPIETPDRYKSTCGFGVG